MRVRMRGTQGAALCGRLANPARGKMCPMLGREVLEAAMGRALELAERSPVANVNPQVGCVILAPTGNIVAEGWHRGAGTPHAEIVALAELSDEWRDRASELTIVVTLEPCNHTGHTGPCAATISEARIGTVVYAVSDPGDVSSGGADTLRDAGVKVLGGVLQTEGLELLAPWCARQQNLGRGSADPSPRRSSPGRAQGSAREAEKSTAHLAQRPLVTVKWAQTLDGRAAAADGSSKWITGLAARLDVHRRRAAADAILVGTGTLLADNPALTARDDDSADGLLVPAAAQPIPVVLGRRAIPAGARINTHPALAARGLTSPLQFSGDDLDAHLAELSTRGVRSVFVEGGPTVASAFLRAGLADEVLVYIAPALLGGPHLALGDLGIDSMAGMRRLTFSSIEHLDGDLLIKASLHDQSESKEGR